MVYDALKKQELKTRLRSKYIFVNPEDEANNLTSMIEDLTQRNLQGAFLVHLSEIFSKL